MVWEQHLLIERKQATFFDNFVTVGSVRTYVSTYSISTSSCIRTVHHRKLRQLKKFNIAKWDFTLSLSSIVRCPLFIIALNVSHHRKCRSLAAPNHLEGVQRKTPLGYVHTSHNSRHSGYVYAAPKREISRLGRKYFRRKMPIRSEVPWIPRRHGPGFAVTSRYVGTLATFQSNLTSS